MNRLKKTIFALILCVVFFVFLNLLAFGIEYLDYGTYWSQGQPVGLYESRSGDRPRLKKGARLNGIKYSVSINSMGFRGAELQQPKPSNGFRIWCIGGSTTFDIYAPSDEKTWCAQLASILQEKYPNRVVESINAGIPGEIIRGSMDDVEAHAQAVQPDVVILYHGPNDLQKIFSEQKMFTNRQIQRPGERHSQKQMEDGFSIGKVLMYDIALFRVVGRWLQTGQHMQLSFPAGSLHVQSQRTLERELSYAVDITRKVGATPIAVSHALRAEENATGEKARLQVGEATMLLQVNPESTIQVYRTYNQILNRVAQQKNISYVDVRSEVPPDSMYWGDATHFLEPGSKITAQTIAQEIIQKRLLE